MGLDAVVHCSCFAMGMTSPPPFPVGRSSVHFGTALPDFVPLTAGSSAAQGVEAVCGPDGP